jgi:hypothetical protein
VHLIRCCERVQRSTALRVAAPAPRSGDTAQPAGPTGPLEPIPTFGQVGYWNILAGMIGAVVAAVTGLVDWTAVPAGTRAKRIGLLHGGGNAAVLLLPRRLAGADGQGRPRRGWLVLEVVAIGVHAAAAQGQTAPH